jgi:hypothetical protein
MSDANYGLNAPVGQCCLGPQCCHPTQELWDMHKCPGCHKHIHVLCGTFVEDFLGKGVHFCPPCHEKEKDISLLSSPLVPPNADLNMVLHGSPNARCRWRTMPTRLAMTKPTKPDKTDKTFGSSPYSVNNPPTENIDLAFFGIIESIDNNNSSIWPLSYDKLQVKTIMSLRLMGNYCFYNYRVANFKCKTKKILGASKNSLWSGL